MINQFLASTLIAGGAFAMVATAGFAAAVAWCRSARTVAVAAGMATLGLVGWVTFWAYLASPVLGRVTAIALLLAAAATLVAAWLSRPEVRWALASVLPVVLMVVGLAAITVALIGIWNVRGDPFMFARTRFSHFLPVDGTIPQLVAERLVVGGDPRTVLANWHSSDRPTLQSGLLLLVYGLTHAVGVAPRMAGLTAGIAAQLFWLPAIALLVRALGGGRRGAFAGMLVTALSGTVLVNTVFTWPKLLSAAFVITALALVLDAARSGQRLRPGRLALAGLLVALGALAHSAAVFAAPVLLLLLLVYRRKAAVSVRGVGALLAAAAATYLPWVLYGRFYDPGGDRVLFWHIVGEQWPDRSKGGLLEQAAHAYADAGWQTVVENKIQNLLFPFSTAPWTGLHVLGIDRTAKRTAEFWAYSGAIGVGWIGMLAALVAVGVALWRRRTPDPYAVRVLLLVGCAFAALVPWALLLFGPGTTYVHHGTHVVILVAVAVPLAWLVDRRPVAGWLVVAFGVATGLYTYLPGAAPAPVSHRALAMAAVGLMCVLVAVALPARGHAASGPRPTPRPLEPLPTAARDGRDDAVTDEARERDESQEAAVA